MSGHRRVKDLSYDDDDYDDYEEEEGAEEQSQGLSQEDQDQLRQGTEAVRQALGEDSTTTNKEIEEALWYYYYDIPKTVAFLQKKHLTQEPKKQKHPSKFEQAAQAAQSKLVSTNNAPYPPSPTTPPVSRCSTHFSAADFFKDIPWFNVPLERRGNILVEPLYPRGGLLGGSSTSNNGKPSKLAALAASRKKAQEEKRKALEQDPGGVEAERKEKIKSLVLLDRLSTRRSEEPDISKQAMEGVKPSTQAAFEHPVQRRYPRREKAEPEPAYEVEPPVKEEISTKEPVEPVEALKAPPSAFAKTMLGPSSVPEHMMEGNMFTLPYPANFSSTNNAFAEPSPDDVVLNAQTKGTKNSKSSAKKSSTNATNVAEGVSTMTLEDAPKSKSKNLDVLAEFKKTNPKNAANFVVIGHVDHGKSTLMGRLLYDLKIVNQRSVDKLKAEATSIGKSSFAFAWVMDSTAEERQRGVTVDIATNNFETEKTRFTILDAPGHRDFIPNMIAGAAQADFAVLVIDASTNAFEAGLRGQTKEHALLVRSMGIARVIVAVNKMDTAQWSHNRFNEISQQMSAFLTTAGFQAKNVAFVPLAGLTGENVVTKPPDGTIPWYTGRTLVEELDASEPLARAVADPLRLTISDVFRGGVQNPLSISGRLDAGSLQMGDVILAMPAGETALIKGVEVDGKAADWAVAGQIATLHLSDIDSVHLRLGDIVCTPSRPISTVKAFTAKVLAFEHLTPGWVDVHKGRLHTPARLVRLVATLEKGSGKVERKKPRVVQPGAVARVGVELEKALPLEVGARVVLRSEGVTIAAGLVEGVEA